MQQENYIEGVMANLREIKRKRREEEGKIKYDVLKPNTSRYTTPYMKECFKKKDLAKVDLKDITTDTIKLNRGAIRREMKKKLRMAWKDPGYSDKPFGPTNSLRNNVLTEW